MEKSTDFTLEPDIGIMIITPSLWSTRYIPSLGLRRQCHGWIDELRLVELPFSAIIIRRSELKLAAGEHFACA
jgi:hypothetical protein